MPSKHILGLPRGKHLFGTVKVGEKGQIVIPKEARKLFHIESGDTLLILGDEHTGIIVSKPEVVNEAAEKVFRAMESESEPEAATSAKPTAQRKTKPKPKAEDST